MNNANPGSQPSTSFDAPWSWTAAQMAGAVRDRKISARELMQSCLTRIEQVNPTLNALAEIDPDAVLAEADAADRQLAKGTGVGPLHGVPVATKINTDQKGFATSNGIAAFREMVAIEDGPPVANLRRAGAVFVGRSNSPAFALRWVTDNDVYGLTLNPWSREHTPGGSSGGAAAAVAAGMVPLAQGNDIGGSVRQPAFCCGIAGLRPTSGRIPSWNGPADADQPLSVQLMAVQGPMARSVEDLRLALDVMRSPDPRDCLHSPVPLVFAESNEPRRVGLLRDVGIAAPSPAVDAALQDSARVLRQAGYVVEEIELPLLEEAYRLWWLLGMGEFRAAMPLMEQVGDDRIRKATSYYYEVIADWCGSSLSLEAYMAGYARRGTLIARLQKFMEHYSLILLPTCTEQAFEQNADVRNVEGMRRVMQNNWSMMAISLLGFPAAAIPTGVVNGLPVGVQVMGRRFREDMVLDTCAVLEAGFGRISPIEPQ